ncbi:phosphoesterase [Paenibacillus sambharensis]|uniref:Phosphoesterase n=1 Tax=Paenibacillus sambharensis TaxID=1803190 RepID=A0A2W1L7A1_9BACL|nr:S-layer homology domain-containing protein [Paenibacillus sambharensis]PZD94020.1 phosphoesterase [Paenibacillus sambharensis]
MKFKRNLSIALSLSMLLGAFPGDPAKAAETAASSSPVVALPAKPAWGHFVDTYKNNITANTTIESNPALGVLSPFLKLWKPGETWDKGVKLNSGVLDTNIQKALDIAAKRTPAEEEMAYYDDRRKQNYGMAEGLGKLTDVYRSKAGVTTTILDIPADAGKVLYNDEGVNPGDPNSELGKMVTLVSTLQGKYSSTSPAKAFYSYPKPFRWTNTDIVVPTLLSSLSEKPDKDGGFPGGRPNIAYLSAFAMAYAVPERYQELLTKASEIGESRIIAGVHSPLDIMGGRMLGTALSAATLADPANASLKQAAYEQARTKLLTETGTAEDRFSDYKKNKAQYIERLTYGFEQINATDKPMVVPKGAEVLLETRLPYLDAQQRRAVLATTGLPSGYPALDDPEGWGRLNLFAAADGYGAFNSDVTVTMNASKGSFHALDRWRNDISGTGKLIKEGSGTLALQGSNTYSGGTLIKAGKLKGESAKAFGTGNVTLQGGTLIEQTAGKLSIGGSFLQSEGTTLELNVASADDVLEVRGAVKANGKLRVNFTDNYVPAAGSTITIMTHGKDRRTGQFTAVTTTGLPNTYKVKVSYQSDRIQLMISGTNSSSPAPSTPAENDKPSADVLQKASISLAATAGANGAAAAELQASQLSDLLSKVDSLTGANRTAEIKIEAASAASSVELTLTKDAVSKLAGSNAAHTVIAAQLGSITLSKTVLNNLENTAGDTVRLKIASASTAAYPSEAKSLVGTRPALEFTVHSGADAIASFGGSGIKLGIPYQPVQGEDSSALVISYVDSNGKLHIIPQSDFSLRDGQLYVVTSHLSTYAVSYNKASFSDTSAHWAASNIIYLAARGIVSGSGDGKFSPNANITRAEFAKMLAGLVSADISKYSSSAFTDVKAGDWFMPYVAWAAENEIVKGGANNQFRPYDRISREEMCVMLARLAALTGYTLPAGEGSAAFADQQRISAWAEDAVRDLNAAGIISGKGNQQFDPQGGATRAEAAKMLTVLLQGMLK